MPPTRTAPSREQLVSRFFELQMVVQRRFESMHGDLPEELQSVTLHQFAVLMRLQRGAASMRTLARDMGTGESAATAVTDRLAKRGLIDRLHDPSDRRVVLVTLSEAGKALVEEFHTIACSRTREKLAALDDRQLAALIDIFETFAEDKK